MKTVKITLDIKEIIYDIQNKTYLTGKSRREGDNHEQVANMQANDDEENANQVLRSISMAYSNLKMKLGEYLVADIAIGDNAPITVDTELTLTLSMPANFNGSAVGTVAAAAHQYLVSMAVADWFMITDKKDSPEYSDMAEISLKIISEAVSKRRRPVRHVNVADNPAAGQEI